MRLFCLALTCLVSLLMGCATAEVKPISSERYYNANSRSVYSAVTEILKKEKIPRSIVDSGEPRVITTDFVETKELNRIQRYRLRIVIAGLSEELTRVEITSFQEYFDDFWKKEWIPMKPAGKIGEALCDKVGDYLKKKRLGEEED